MSRTARIQLIVGIALVVVALVALPAVAGALHTGGVDRARVAGPAQEQRQKQGGEQGQTQGRDGSPGVVPFRGMGFRDMGMGRGLAGPLQSVSALLDMAPQQIVQAMANGQTLAEIGASKGVSQQQLVDAIVAPQKERVEQAVAAGNLSQEQADAIIKGMTYVAEALVRGEAGAWPHDGTFGGASRTIPTPGQGYGSQGYGSRGYEMMPGRGSAWMGGAAITD